MSGVALAFEHERDDQKTIEKLVSEYDQDSETIRGGAPLGEEAASTLVAQTEHDTVAVSYRQLLDAVRKASNGQNTGIVRQNSELQAEPADAGATGQTDA